MCDVCVAESALSRGGAVIRWSDAPRNIPVVHVIATGKGAEFKPARFRVRLTCASLAEVAVNRERKKLGLKRGELAPKCVQKKMVGVLLRLVKRDQDRAKWSTPMRTADLAGAMSQYGFDTPWRFVPKLVKAWLRGERKMPTVAELKAEQSRA
jgi:hypothetical protein